MTRILIVQTGFPQRVRIKAEEILEGRAYPEPRVTILCPDNLETAREFEKIAGVEVVPLWEHQKKRILRELKSRRFDVMVVFWSGEKGYARMKRLAFGFHAGKVEVNIGDGSSFRLTWKAIIRHSLFRLRHRLPTDHWQHFAPEAASSLARHDGEKILVVQSAEPPHVIAALQSLKTRPLFRNPRYTLFCRNRPEVVGHFESHPMIHSVHAHSETRGTMRHLRQLRRERYDAVILFLTGDPGYWKVKLFAFLVGARHRLIYNENNDCYYFSLRKWLPLMAHRIGERSRPGAPPRWASQARILVSLLIKTLVFPFRFAWLLLVWLRLRSAGMKVRVEHDRPL